MFQVSARARLLSTVVAAVVLHGACSESAPPPPPPAPTPAVKTAEQRVEGYKACWDQFNNKQWDQFQNCYAENAVSEAIDSIPASLTGRAAIIERAKTELASFPDRRGEVRLLLVNGDRLASLALYTGTNGGAIPQPDGKPAPATNKTIGVLVGHTIDMDPTGAFAVREATYVDGNTMAAQLGLSPAPARPAEKATGAPPEVVIAKNDDKERTNIELVRRSFAALNAHDVKGLLDTMAPNYRGMDQATPKDMTKAESEKTLKEMMASFPDVKITPVTMWAAGDYVVVTGTFEGTNLGDIPSMGLKKTGRKVSAHFFEVFKIENGLAKDDWLIYNGAAMAAQLGLK